MHYKVCFSFSLFYLFACQWLFLCATFLDSEPLHFASKCVELLHASLYRWSLKDKLTLDLSHYIWKSVVGVGGIPLVVNFFSFLIVSEYYLKY